MREIQLTHGKVALVDDEDYERINQWRWIAYQGRHTWYAHTSTCVKVNGKPRHLRMHRMIMGEPKGMVDHRDGNGLHNVRSNLRVATDSQNMANQKLRCSNTSGYKGVQRSRYGKRWTARIKVNGKEKSLGGYEKIEDAARAYDAAAKEYFGEFARLNFPE